MLSEFLELDIYQQSKIVFAYISAVCALIGAVSIIIKRKSAKEKRLTDIESRLDAIDKGDYSRLNLLHKLARDEIDTSKEAIVKAEKAQATADTIMALLKKTNR